MKHQHLLPQFLSCPKILKFLKMSNPYEQYYPLLDNETPPTSEGLQPSPMFPPQNQPPQMIHPQSQPMMVFQQQNQHSQMIRPQSQPMPMFQQQNPHPQMYQPQSQHPQMCHPQNQPPHTGGNVQNPSYQMFPQSFYHQNQPQGQMGSYPSQMSYPNNPQYCMYPPQYQAPPTGSSSSSKVSSTQCEAMPDEPEFSTQRGLDDIDLEESGKKRTKWSGKDNILLLQSWLNVSTDRVVGNEQKSDLFWNKIRAQYEEYRDDASPSRTWLSLKSHFNKLNADLQKFVGCHTKAVNHWKSGHSDKDIMATAHQLYHVDTGKDFKHENEWRLVKDEPKWKGTFMTTSSTRQKKSGDGVYATSSDRSASIEGDEYEATQPATRPLGKKNQKRKAKVGDTASSDLDYVPNSEMIAIGKAKLGFLASFEKLKTEELEVRKEKNKLQKARLLKEYKDILMEDTSEMNEVQLATHQRLVEFAMKELGMS